MQLRLLATGVLGACLLVPFSALAQTAPPPDAQPITTPPGTAHPGVVFIPAPVVVEQTPAAAPVVDAPAAAASEAPAPTPAKRPAQHDNWYGGQTLLVDGAATAMMIGGAAKGDTNVGATVAVGGLLTYLLGAPIVHFAHERIGPGFGSFALRLGLPLEAAFDGALIGAAMDNRRDRYDDGEGNGALFGAGIGFVSGMVGAMVIDSALLAHEKVDDAAPPSRDAAASDSAKSSTKEARSRVSPLHVDWMPTAAPVHGGATIGLSGRF